MAPVTRSQTKAIAGEFVKDVLGQPPVLDIVLQHLVCEYGQSPLLADRIYSDRQVLGNLLLVLKAPAPRDVILKRIDILKKAQTSFCEEMKKQLNAHSSIDNMNEEFVDEEYERVKGMYELILLNRDVLTQSRMFEFIYVTIAKLKLINSKHTQFRLKYGNKLLQRLTTQFTQFD